MTRFFFAALTAAALLLSSSARADDCDDLVPADQDPRMFVDLVKECREQATDAALADAIAAGAKADQLRDERLARLEAARAATPAPVPPQPPAPAQAVAQPTTPVASTPAPQPVAYVPSGPVLGQVIPIGVAIGSMPPSGSSIRAGIHVSPILGTSRVPVNVNDMVCASDGGLPIGIAGGMPIAVSVGSQVVTKLCAPAGTELNVFNLASSARVGFDLYRASPSRLGVYDLYATLSCSGSTRGGMQPMSPNGCNITHH